MTIFASIGMSLDGYAAGPNAGPDNPLGDGGQRIHEWQYPTQAWRSRLRRRGGETGQDDELAREKVERSGAYVMGRRMFDEGEVNWPDPPPFEAPVFVVTHGPRDPWERGGGTTFHFATDGVDDAVEQARAAAGGKDVQVAGGANTVQQVLATGLLDELQIHIAPVLLGSGVKLLDPAVCGDILLEPTRIVKSPVATHVRYQVVR